MGRDRQRGLALAHGHAAERRLRERAAQRRRPARRRSMGPGAGRRVRSVRRRRVAAHADAPAHSLGRRRRGSSSRRTPAGKRATSTSARRRLPRRASLQGQSTAKWVTPPRPAGGPGLAGAGGGAAARAGGYLEVKTTNLTAGLAAPQRRAVQRGRRRHGVLRALRGAERRRVAHGDDDRRRPALSRRSATSRATTSAARPRAGAGIRARAEPAS